MLHDGIDAAHIERLHLRSTRPAEEIEYDGWLVRTARDDVKRARSVNVVGASSLPLDAKIEPCESLYAEVALATVFRLTSFGAPAGLDAALDARGYGLTDRTLQQVARLDHALASAPDGVTFGSMTLAEWLEAASSIRRQSQGAREAEYRRLLHCELAVHYLVAYAGDEPVACGIVLLDGAFATLMDINVEEGWRGGGIGTAISAELLSTAQHGGAEVAWLNVLADNEPAIRTYARLGFETLYEYWYRIMPLAEGP